jgi:chromate transporter
MVLKGMSAAIAAIIVDVVYRMGAEIIRNKVFYSIAILFLAFLAKIFFDRIVLILLVCGVIGLLVAAFGRKTGKAVGKL